MYSPSSIRPGSLTNHPRTRSKGCKAPSFAPQELPARFAVSDEKLMTATRADTETTTEAGLSTLDRWLPAWIGLAMLAGLLLGRQVSGVSDLLTRLEVGG